MSDLMQWNACTMEPSAVLRWIECHPGLAGYVQAVGAVAAIAVALAFPWLMRERDRKFDAGRVATQLAAEVADWGKEIARLVREAATVNTDHESAPKLGIRQLNVNFAEAARLGSAVVLELASLADARVAVISARDAAFRYGTGQDDEELVAFLDTAPQLVLRCAKLIVEIAKAGGIEAIPEIGSFDIEVCEKEVQSSAERARANREWVEEMLLHAPPPPPPASVAP